MTRLFATIAVSLIITALPVGASASDVQQWLALRDPARSFSFQSYVNFFNKHPDWPDKATLQMRAEDSITPGFTDSTIVRFFDANPPVTDHSRQLYIEALARTGNGIKALTVLRKAWQAGVFDSDMQDALRAEFPGQLNAHDNNKRLDTLLWNSNTDRAEKALTYAAGDAKTIGQARLRLQRFRSQASQEALQLINSGVADDGLYFDLVRFYRQRDQDVSAINVLKRFKGNPSDHAALWWRERAILARRALEDGNYSRAYQLAAAHGQTSAVELADAEWLAGWLAVTRLHKPEEAFKHFERMYHNVKTPISVARAAYWAGLAASQMKQDRVATEWYQLAAQHMSTFYGQMAAYALGDPAQYYKAFFARSRKAPAAQNLRSDYVDAARWLHANGHEKERDLFLMALLNDAKVKNNSAAVIALAKSLGSQRVALLAAKTAYDNGTLIKDALFPIINVPKQDGVEKSLALGIIRQESQFDRYAVSPADARGLMQLMPRTAAHTARQCLIPHRSAAQLFLPDHNMKIGQAYLNKMLRKYDGFVPLAAAAYNAGPSNVDTWLAELGDPRNDPHSWVDWAERIPFAETRNYVQRVWESYSVYKALGVN